MSTHESMTPERLTEDRMDLTSRHIGRQARYEAIDHNGHVTHEGRVNNIQFHTEHVCDWGGGILQDIITAEVCIGYEWYPLTHVRFAETPGTKEDA